LVRSVESRGGLRRRVELGGDRAVVGGWVAVALVGGVADGAFADVVGGDLPEPAQQGVGHEDVVDELAAALVGPLLLGGDFQAEVPQPHPVALVGVVEPAGADLRAARPS